MLTSTLLNSNHKWNCEKYHRTNSDISFWKWSGLRLKFPSIYLIAFSPSANLTLSAIFERKKKCCFCCCCCCCCCCSSDIAKKISKPQMCSSPSSIVQQCNRRAHPLQKGIFFFHTFSPLFFKAFSRHSVDVLAEEDARESEFQPKNDERERELFCCPF